MLKLSSRVALEDLLWRTFCPNYSNSDYLLVFLMVDPTSLEELGTPYHPRRPLRPQNAALLQVPRVSIDRSLWNLGVCSAWLT